MRIAVVAAIALAIVQVAQAAPPRKGVVVPGLALGGLTLGSTRAEVRAAWGSRYGICRDCAAPTWYFNLKPFEPQGAGVSFRQGHAVALFTIWSPPDWRTDRGLRIGDPSARIVALYGPMLQRNCGTYSAMTLRRGRTTTSFYVVSEQVWGFGLSLPSEPVCR